MVGGDTFEPPEGEHCRGVYSTWIGQGEGTAVVARRATFPAGRDQGGITRPIGELAAFEDDAGARTAVSAAQARAMTSECNIGIDYFAVLATRAAAPNSNMPAIVFMASASLASLAAKVAVHDRTEPVPFGVTDICAM